MSDPDVVDGSILIIDDEPSNLRFLERLLVRNGYTRIHATTCPEEGIDIFARTTIDLVLLDLAMPGLDGFRVMEQLKRHTAAGDYVPVLVLTGNPRPEVRNQALAGGARDFLAKPFDPSEALLRIRNLLDTRYLQRTLALHNETLEERVRERTRELEEAQLEILRRLAMVAEYYDDDTAEHTRRVASLSEDIARKLGMPEADATLLGRAALLHDVGKIAVPAGLTRKPGRLDSAERDVMQRHAVEGARVLSGSRLPLMRMAEEVARSHHEHWDGRGYPDGLRGEAIPLSGRIVAVADVYDALTNVRPYKGAWTTAEALAEIRARAGTHFDPRVVDALEQVLAGARPPTSPRRSAVPPAVAAVARRSALVALVAGFLVLAPAALTGQHADQVRATAHITIPPLAQVTTVAERAFEPVDGGVAIELTVGVRANSPYRLSLALPRDASDPVTVLWADTASGERVLRPGTGVVVATGGRTAGERLHTITVRAPDGRAHASVIVQVDVD